MPQPHRNTGEMLSGGSRYGYQGSEADDEVKGEGNSYTTFFRELDPRIGRWLSIDPKSHELPCQSPYISMDNAPIINIDPIGDIVDPEGSSEQKDAYIGQLNNYSSKLNFNYDGSGNLSVTLSSYIDQNGNEQQWLYNDLNEFERDMYNAVHSPETVVVDLSSNDGYVFARDDFKDLDVTDIGILGFQNNELNNLGSSIYGAHAKYLNYATDDDDMTNPETSAKIEFQDQILDYFFPDLSLLDREKFQKNIKGFKIYQQVANEEGKNKNGQSIISYVVFIGIRIDKDTAKKMGWMSAREYGVVIAPKYYKNKMNIVYYGTIVGLKKHKNGSYIQIVSP